MADRVETIGIYSAYGFAKEAGYTGTKAEFEQGLKNSAEYASNAAASANAATNAKNAAVTAKTDAQAAQSAAEAAQGLAEDAQAAAEEAKNDAEAAAASLDASTIARIDGFYENMGVGTADQLMASQKVNDSDPYIFRTSGGTSDIGNREELEIVGGSIVWNQLASDNLFSGGTKSKANVSITDGITKLTATDTGEQSVYKALDNISLNHVYFAQVSAKADAAGVRFGVSLNQVSVTVNKLIPAGSSEATVEASTDFTTYQGIGKYTTEGAYIRVGTASAAALSVGDALYLKDMMLFDLTQMFGSEIADHVYELEQTTAGAGVAWFRKYFPNDYYAYNPGELMHVTDLQSHDMVGFNAYDHTTRTAKLVGGQQYQITGAYTDLTIDGEVITPDSNGYFTPEKNSVLTVTGGNSTTTCVHLVWSGTRDDEYEPYVKHSYPLDSSLTLKGVPQLSADGELYFDGDGYSSDGTVKKRTHIVSDLGTLNWTYVNSTNQFRATLPGYDSSNMSAFMTAEYKYKYVRSISSLPNKAFCIFWSTVKGINIRDDSFAGDLNAFIAHITGHKLVYIGTTTTEQAEPYTSPQIVDDWGTEEFVTTSLVPVGHNTSYPANLRDKLQHLPDLPDDDGYYMTQVTGTQMSLVRFRIPQAPAEDGEYILKATVSNGTPTYTWEAVVEAEGGEG